MLLRSTRYKEAGVLPNGNEALSYFQKACDQDFRNGCFMLSVVYLRGTLPVAAIFMYIFSLIRVFLSIYLKIVQEGKHIVL